MTVAGTEVSDYAQTLGRSNILVDRREVAPVHATTDDMGLESAFPTTGSMLLLMRYANTEMIPANAEMTATAGSFDTGHMPVFDQTQLAQVGLNILGAPEGRLTRFAFPNANTKITVLTIEILISTRNEIAKFWFVWCELTEVIA